MANETLGTLGIDVKIDFSEITKQLKQVSRTVNRVSNNIETKTESAFKSMSRNAGKAVAQTKVILSGITGVVTSIGSKIISIFTSVFRRIVRIVKTSMLAIGVAMAGFATFGTKLAIDAKEVENLMEVSFGNMQQAAEDWVNSFADGLGLYKPAVKNYVATLNIMTKAMGLTDKQSLELSQNLTKRAFDLASLRNLRIEEAFTKITAALSGESEPLKRLGYIINETTTKQFAYAKGIAETGKELSETQKVQARYLQIMELTAKAQNDLANTADQPANALRLLGERFKTTAASVGNAVIGSETFQRTLQGLSKLITKLERPFTALFLIGFNKLDQITRKITVKGLVQGFVSLINVITPFIQKINAGIRSLIQWGKQEKNIQKIKDVLNEVVEVGKIVIDVIYDMGLGIKQFATGSEQDVGDAGAAVNNFLVTITSLSKVMTSLLGTIGAVNNVIFKFTDAISGSNSGLVRAIIQIYEVALVLFAIKKPILAIKGIFSAIGAVVLYIAEALGLASAAAVSMGNAMLGVLVAAAAAVGWLAGKFTLFITKVLLKSLGIFDAVNNAIDNMIGGIVKLITFIPGMKKLLGIQKDVNAERAAEIIKQREERRVAIPELKAPKISAVPVASPQSLSNANQASVMTAGDRAILDQLRKLTTVTEGQPKQQNKLMNVYG